VSHGQDERNAVYRGHSELLKAITGSGELISTVASADPSRSAAVEVRPLLDQGGAEI
jgi:hydroxyethylthiazole kinase-like sugar kinase family protein